MAYKTIDHHVVDGQAIHSYRRKGAVNLHEISYSLGNVFVVSFNKKQLSSYDLHPIFDYSEYSRFFGAEPKYLVFDLSGVEQLDEGAVRILVDWYKYNTGNKKGYTTFVNASDKLKSLINSSNPLPNLKERLNNKSLGTELKKIERDFLGI